MWGYIAAAAAAIVPTGLAGAAFLRSRTFSARVDGEITGLARRAEEAPTRRIDLSAHDLPAPVRRYLERAGVDGRESVAFTRLRHGGSWRPDLAHDWREADGEAYYLAAPPAYVWRADAGRARLRDRYDQGRGYVQVTLMGALTLADVEARELDVSGLLRWLAATPCFPTALVPGEHLSWEPVDARSARARLRDGVNTVSGLFHFDAEGRIAAFTTDERFRRSGKRFERRPWRVAYAAYEDRDGFEVPLHLELTWELPEGELRYARFEVTDLDHDETARWPPR